MISLTMLCESGLEKSLVNPEYIKMVKPLKRINYPKVNAVVRMDDHQFWCAETVEEIEKMLKAEV